MLKQSVRYKILLTLFILGVISGDISFAFAQNTSSETKPESATSESQTGDLDKDLSERDKSLQWSDIRGIRTIHKRGFRKERKLALTLYSGMIPNNIFEQYIPVGLRLDYFVLENIGIEIAGAYAIPVSTDLNRYILDTDGVGAAGVLLKDIQRAHTNASVVWSPFFGKTAFRNETLKYFDLYLVGGVGLIYKQSQKDFNAPLVNEIKVEGVLGAGLFYFLMDRGALRFDFRQFLFAKTFGGVATPSEISVGFSYFFL